MRPAGAYERFRALQADDVEYLRVHPELVFRTELTRFVHLAARQWYEDLPLSSALDSLWTVAALLHDPTQRRTGTDFERRSIACLEQLRRVVDDFSGSRPDATPQEVDDALSGPFVHLPPTVVLGEDGPDNHFGLMCWNAANSFVEGIRRPYWAARPVVHAAYHRPADPFDVVAPPHRPDRALRGPPRRARRDRGGDRRRAGRVPRIGPLAARLITRSAVRWPGRRRAAAARTRAPAGRRRAARGRGSAGRPPGPR